MKKLLATLLLSLGVASVAHAQSSVTMYGILDMGYSGISTRTGNVKTQTNKFDQSAEIPSRLGVRGTEDLGGGTSAFFTAEFALFPQDARLSGNSTNGLVNRQTFVGLRQKDMGQFAVGTQFTPIFWALVQTDPGQVNDVVGNVLVPVNNSAGVTTTAFTMRSSNALTVKTDRFKGFSANAMYAANNRDTTQTGINTGGNTNINGYALSTDYVWQKLYVTANYQSFRNENPSATASLTATLNDNGSNVVDNQIYLGASYDFGFLKAYAGWIDRKATSVLNSNEYMSRTAQQIGVRGFITSKVEGWASVGNGKYQKYGIGEPTANFVGYQLGSNYWLSKRTNLYAIAGSTQATSTSTTASAGANQYALGVRHTF
jgi:predicted porin